MTFRDTILRNCLDDNARDARGRYFFSGLFTGADFEPVADCSNPDTFTARDIVAVSMLGVNVPADTSTWLLKGAGQEKANSLLRLVPSDLDIWDAAEHLGPGQPLWKLWDLLLERDRVGPTICSKLLAAKRPRLVPIMDSVVVGVFGRSPDYWKDFRVALEDTSVRARIVSASDNAPSHVSLLRRIDVVVWMLNRSMFPDRD